MMQAEFVLLVQDKLPQAEVLVRRQALPNSLTAKVLDGWFGEASKRALLVRKARELALRTLV